jgi:hypothetical protein
MRFAPAPGIALGEFRIVFEETPLELVRVKVGAGTISLHGHGAGTEYWLCYTVASPHSSERLWLISNAEMGAAILTRIEAISLKSAEASNDCPLLPRRFVPVALDSRLWLGSSATDLARILGKPSHAAHRWQNYNFQTKASADGQCEGGYDQLNYLDVKVLGGFVVAVWAGQVTSC